MTQQNYMLIFSLLVGVWIGYIIKIILPNFIKIFTKYHLYFKQRKLYNQKMYEMNKMIESGDCHEWVEINVMGKNLHVCCKTGYCPDIEGFVDQQTLDFFKDVENCKLRYVDYKGQELTRISKKYNIEIKELANLINEIIEIDIKFEEFYKKE